MTIMVSHYCCFPFFGDGRGIFHMLCCFLHELLPVPRKTVQLARHSTTEEPGSNPTQQSLSPLRQPGDAARSHFPSTLPLINLCLRHLLISTGPSGIFQPQGVAQWKTAVQYNSTIGLKCLAQLFCSSTSGSNTSMVGGRG